MFSLPSAKALGPTQPPIQWVTCLFNSIKAAGAWPWPLTSHLPPKVKERVQLYSTSPLVLFGLFWDASYLYLYPYRAVSTCCKSVAWSTSTEFSLDTERLLQTSADITAILRRCSFRHVGQFQAWWLCRRIERHGRIVGTPASYYSVLTLNFRPGSRLRRTRFITIFLKSSRRFLKCLLRLDFICFSPRSSQVTNHWT